MSDLFDYIETATVDVKAVIFKDASEVLERVGQSECMDRALELILSYGDASPNDAMNAMEDLYINYFMETIRLHGVFPDEEQDIDLRFCTDFLNNLLSLASFEDREIIIDAIDDSDGDSRDTLLDILLLLQPELDEGRYFQFVEDVSDKLIDRIEELMEQDEVVDETEIQLSTRSRDRFSRSPYRESDGPVYEYILFEGGFESSVKTLELLLEDQIADLDTIEEKAIQCYLLALISDVPDDKLEGVALSVATSVVENYEDIASITKHVKAAHAIHTTQSLDQKDTL